MRKKDNNITEHLNIMISDINTNNYRLFFLRGVYYTSSRGHLNLSPDPLSIRSEISTHLYMCRYNEK